VEEESSFAFEFAFKEADEEDTGQTLCEVYPLPIYL
jgi:hypothetical protein